MTSLGDNRLRVLASEIRSAHAQALQAAQTSLQSAMAAGGHLIEAKQLVPHGQWLPWLGQNVIFSERTAQVYIRLAKNKDKITKSAAVADLTLRAAVDVLTISDPDRVGFSRLLPLEGHVRVGVAAGEDQEIWIAPSRHHPGFVFITYIEADEIIGSRRPVAVSWVAAYFSALHLKAEDFEWHDEPFPEWAFNILLFDSTEQWLATADLPELLELLADKKANRLGEPQEPWFQKQPLRTTPGVSLHHMVFEPNGVSA